MRSLLLPLFAKLQEQVRARPARSESRRRLAELSPYWRTAPLGTRADRSFTRPAIQRFEEAIGRRSHNPQARANRDSRNWDNRGALAHRKHRRLAIDR